MATKYSIITSATAIMVDSAKSCTVQQLAYLFMISLIEKKVATQKIKMMIDNWIRFNNVFILF